MLGKFKPLNSAIDLCRFVDILENKRFYFPRVAELNDPLEGRGSRIMVNGYAGISIALNAGRLPSPVASAIDNSRALCLTSDCRNPQMWTHYADGFKGACVCVNRSGVFDSAAEVQYWECADLTGCKEFADSYEELEAAAQRALLIKQRGWSYEQEYRIIYKPSESEGYSYFQFESHDLEAVIIGHCAAPEVHEYIRNVCKRLNLPLYTTLIRDLQAKVEIVPEGFRANHDGSLLDDQLSRYYEDHPQCDFADLETK